MAFLPAVCLLNNNIQNQVNDFFSSSFSKHNQILLKKKKKNRSIGRTPLSPFLLRENAIYFSHGASDRPKQNPARTIVWPFTAVMVLKWLQARGLFMADQAAQLRRARPRQTARRAGELSGGQRMSGWVNEGRGSSVITASDGRCPGEVLNVLALITGNKLCHNKNINQVH